MGFGLTVSPDTAFKKPGDTIIPSGGISSTLSNGVKIEDGEAEIALFYGYTEQTPFTLFRFSTPK